MSFFYISLLSARVLSMCKVEFVPSSRQRWVGQLLKAAGLMRSRMRRLLKMVAAVFGHLPFII